MNTEQIEAALVDLNKKPVVIVLPYWGRISFSYAGELNVTRGQDFTVGFHFISTVGAEAIIFTAEDVSKIEDPTPQRHSHIIRLNGPHWFGHSTVRQVFA